MSLYDHALVSLCICVLYSGFSSEHIVLSRAGPYSTVAAVSFVLINWEKIKNVDLLFLELSYFYYNDLLLQNLFYHNNSVRQNSVLLLWQSHNVMHSKSCAKVEYD